MCMRIVPMFDVGNIMIDYDARKIIKPFSRPFFNLGLI